MLATIEGGTGVHLQGAGPMPHGGDVLVSKARLDIAVEEIERLEAHCTEVAASAARVGRAATGVREQVRLAHADLNAAGVPTRFTPGGRHMSLRARVEHVLKDGGRAVAQAHTRLAGEVRALHDDLDAAGVPPSEDGGGMFAFRRRVQLALRDRGARFNQRQALRDLGAQAIDEWLDRTDHGRERELKELRELLDHVRRELASLALQTGLTGAPAAQSLMTRLLKLTLRLVNDVHPEEASER